MSKFHINKHGVPAPCRAANGNCPLGGFSGDQEHFDTKEEAQEYVDKKNEDKYGVTPEMAESGDVIKPEKRRVKMRFIDTDTRYWDNGLDTDSETHYIVKDLDGNERRINEIDFSEMRRGGLIATGDDVEFSYESEETRADKELIDVKSYITDHWYGDVDISRRYRVMDKDGSKEWMSQGEYMDLDRSGAFDSKEIEEALPEIDPEPESGKRDRYKDEDSYLYEDEDEDEDPYDSYEYGSSEALPEIDPETDERSKYEDEDSYLYEDEDEDEDPYDSYEYGERNLPEIEPEPEPEPEPEIEPQPEPESEPKPEPKRRRTKMKYIDTKTRYWDNGSDTSSEDYHIVEGLDGRRRRISDHDFSTLSDSGLMADGDEDPYEVQTEKTEGSIENKKKLIDVENYYVDNGSDVSSETRYRLMDSNGDAKWFREDEYSDLDRSGNLASKNEGFDFPETPNERPRPKPKPTIMGRIRRVFGR